jgi:hypothetical protein
VSGPPPTDLTANQIAAMSPAAREALEEAQFQLAVAESLRGPWRPQAAAAAAAAVAVDSPLPRMCNVDAGCWVNTAVHIIWDTEGLPDAILAEDAPAWMCGDKVAIAMRGALQDYRANVETVGATLPLSLEKLHDVVTEKEFAGGQFKRGLYADAGELVAALLNHLAGLGAAAAAAVDRSVGLGTGETGYCDSCQLVYRQRHVGATRMSTLAWATLRDLPAGAGGRLTRALLVQNSLRGNCEECGESTPVAVSLHVPPPTVLITIAWEPSSMKDPAAVSAALDAIDEGLDLAAAFNLSDASGATIASAPYRASAMAMQVEDRHYVTFVRHGPSDGWVLLDDAMPVEQLRGWAEVAAACKRGRMCPTLITFTRRTG